MHSYLPAIGFHQLKKKSQFQKLLETVTAAPDSVIIVPSDEESSYAMLTKEVEDGIGLALCGETDAQGHFQMEYHFPYFYSDMCSTTSECMIKRQSDKESYSGVCDDIRLGLNLIFFVNNYMEYKKAESIRKKWPETQYVCLSALCISGKVLLPISKTPRQMEAIRRENTQCTKLMEAARQGDQDAMEDLAVIDMNLSSQVSQRLQKQDIYSIVETFFMPCGVECDQYTMMGYITSVKKTANRLTGEGLYLLDILCNDLPIRVCIAQEDLLGVPRPGYRFKGDIWLQGRGILEKTKN